MCLSAFDTDTLSCDEQWRFLSEQLSPFVDSEFSGTTITRRVYTAFLDFWLAPILRSFWSYTVAVGAVPGGKESSEVPRF